MQYLAEPWEQALDHFFEAGFNPMRNIYRQSFQDMALDPQEALDLTRHLESLPFDTVLRHRLISSLLYARTLEGNQPIVFRERLSLILTDYFFESSDPLVVQFRKHSSKIHNYRKKIEAREYERLRRDRRTPANRALVRARDRSFKQTAAYERLYYACRNTVKTPDNPASETRMLTWAITAGGVGSTMTTYSIVNWDKEKDADWYKELFFVIGMSLVLNYVNGRFILANPALSPWRQRLPLTMGVVAAQDIGVTALYGLIFSKGDDELLARLQEIEDSGEFDELKRELIEIIEANDLFEKHRDATLALFSKLDIDENGDQTTRPLTPEEWESFSFDDLNTEATLELLLQAYAQFEYEQEKGPLNLGSKTYDRYAFHRMLDFGFMPASILSSLIMYKQICMATNPKVGITKAILTFMATKLLLDTIYFASRRHVIGQ